MGIDSFKVFANPQAVAQAAADYLVQKIRICVSEKNQCHVVLPGGSTPALCLELLADKPLPWKNIHWYPGDERCYPVGHKERNDTMIIDKLFARQQNPAENFHAIPAELGPELAAARYAALIKEVGKIDIVVLGMGEDGHTASLFPGNVALDDLRCVVPVYNAPKPPDERVSMGLNTLKNAAECIVIATGNNKYDALKKVRAEEPLPINLVQPDIWFVDEVAMNGTDP